MLIIFDLDDTLVDTSGCITPRKLEGALRLLIERGLKVASFDEALELLKRINRLARNAEEALAEFIKFLKADPSLLPIAVEEVYGPIPPDLNLKALDGALEVLTELSKDHTLALVTVGKFDQQMDKLKKAGIDSSFFSKIIVSEKGEKKGHYQKLAEFFGFSPSQIMVCGDRIHVDLAPARELGYTTVQMRWGRGLSSVEGGENVDHTILALKEIKRIISV